MNAPIAISTTFRRARPPDAEKIITGINSICAEGGAFYTTRFVDTPQWNSVLYHPETVLDHMLMVADYQGQIVAAARLFPGGKYTLLNHVVELGIFVLQSFRNQGIGTHLFAALTNWALQEGFEKISLSVFATNQPAISFYRKHGFLEEGRLRSQVKVGESYTDLLLMGLFLCKD